MSAPEPATGQDAVGKLPQREIIHRGWTTFGIATIADLDGTQVRRAFEDHGTAAAVLPYDPRRRVATLVRQVRVAPVLAGEHGTLAEVPAGCVEAGEDPAVAVVREAMEEAGLRLAAVEAVGQPYAMPSISTERMFLFLAEYGEDDRVASGGGLAAEGEQLIVEEVPLARLAEEARQGTTRDMKSLVLIQALMLRRPELFTD